MLYDQILNGSPAKDHERFYPWGRSLVLTRPTELLSSSRIQHWQAEIEAGGRPIAVTVSMAGGDCEFVVDGHHKLFAYQHVGVKPALIGIRRLTHSHLPRTTPSRLTSRWHPLVRHYKRVKRRIAPEWSEGEGGDD